MKVKPEFWAWVHFQRVERSLSSTTNHRNICTTALKINNVCCCAGFRIHNHAALKSEWRAISVLFLQDVAVRIVFDKLFLAFVAVFAIHSSTSSSTYH